MATGRPHEEFPWYRCRPGDSFFVLSLDPRRTAHVGLRVGTATFGRRVVLHARPGVYRGFLGVLFTLPASRPRS